jgi:hypothetical protein
MTCGWLACSYTKTKESALDFAEKWQTARSKPEARFAHLQMALSKSEGRFAHLQTSSSKSEGWFAHLQMVLSKPEGRFAELQTALSKPTGAFARLRMLWEKSQGGLRCLLERAGIFISKDIAGRIRSGELNDV